MLRFVKALLIWSCALHLISLSIASHSNYYRKVITEVGNKKIYNTLGFPHHQFSVKASNVKDFDFSVYRPDCVVDNVTMNIALADGAAVQLTLRSEVSLMFLPTGKQFMLVPLFPNERQKVNLMQSVQIANLMFKQVRSEYVLDVSIEHSSSTECSFTLEWSKNVNIHLSGKNNDRIQRPEPPGNYTVAVNSTEADPYVLTSGSVSFYLSNGVKLQTYDLLHPGGDESPIFSIVSSSTCKQYMMKMFINDHEKEYVVIKRENNEVILTDENGSQSFNDISDFPVRWFYGRDHVYFTMYDTNEGLRMYSKKLTHDSDNRTKLSFTSSSTDTTDATCDADVMLHVGEKVGLLLPNETSTEKEIVTVSETLNETTTTVAVEPASMSLGVLIAIVAIVVLIVIIIAGGLTLWICRRHRKKKKAKATKKLDISTSMLDNNSMTSVIATAVEAKSNSRSPKKDGPSKEVAGEVKSQPAKDDPKKDGIVPKPAHTMNVKSYGTTPSTQFVTGKSLRFDPQFVKDLIPAAFNELNKFYEDPVDDETVDWDKIGRNFELPKYFWDMLPMFKISRRCKIELEEGRENNWCFVMVRDVTKPKNKIFRKFANRLNDPMDKFVVVVKKGDEKKSKRYACGNRVYVLSYDPPLIEWIFDKGIDPPFISDALDCRHCRFEDKVKVFTSGAKLVEIIHTVPLGHHFWAYFARPETSQRGESCQGVIVIKGGQTKVPLMLRHAFIMHHTGIFIEPKKRAKKNSQTSDGEKIATLHSSKSQEPRPKSQDPPPKSQGRPDSSIIKTAPTQASVDNVENRD